MSSIWDENGRIRIEVTAEHIARAMQRNSSHCAIAMAIKDQIKDAKFICVDLQCIRFSRKQMRYLFLTPHAAAAAIINFDQGLLVEPFTLSLRPAIISRVGRKATHAPDDDQLKAAGLNIRANRRQLHTDGWPPPRPPLDPNRDLSPDRSDGLYVAPRAPDRGVAPEPRRKRQPRAVISTPSSKGSIPTTLGGKMPPVSALSARREFGLRALRA